jgi:serine/threonine protein kinase
MSFGITESTLRFQKISEISHEGLNSEVYLAHDQQFNANLVIKQISKTVFSDPSEFFDEATRLYSAEHPYVVRLNYATQDANNVYLAMPYYENGSINKLINSRFLTVKEVLRYAIHFLIGVNNIHYKKLIHFDIKPDNILLSDNDEAMVSDFGLARNMNAWGIASQDFVYRHHTPPEYFSSSDHDMTYDIYQAGVTLYRMCNGNDVYNQQKLAYSDLTKLQSAIKSGKFPNRNYFLPHIPKSLRRSIKKAMSTDPNKRFATALDFMNDLNSVTTFLNWQYSTAANGHTWILNNSDKHIEVNVKPNGRLYNIETYKTVLASGNKTKVTSGWLKNITNAEIENHAQTIFASYE